MTQVFMSMAKFNLAVDIEPAKMVPQAKDAPDVNSTQASSQAHDSQDASFQHALAKAEQDNGPQSAKVDIRQTKSSPPAKHDDDHPDKVSDDNESRAGYAGVSSPDQTAHDQATQTVSQNAAKPDSTPVQASTGANAQSETASVDDSPQILSRFFFQQIVVTAQGSVSADQLGDILNTDVTPIMPGNNGQIDLAGTIQADKLAGQWIPFITDENKSGGSKSDSLRDAVLTMNPIRSGVIQQFKVNEQFEAITAKIDLSDSQYANLTHPRSDPNQGSNPSDANRPVITEAVSKQSIDTPQPQWKEILEFTSLLNGKGANGSGSSIDISDSRPAPSPVWAPRPRVEMPIENRSQLLSGSEPRRDSMGSTVGRTTDAVWSFAQSKQTPVTPIPVVQDAVYRPVYKPIIEEPATDLQSAGPLTIGQPVIGSKPVPQADLLSAVSPEKLVSDVREAVIRMASDGRTQARLVLHPPELGEIIVRLESAKNGIMRAEFHTQSPLVRETLEAGLSKLLDALKSEGLTLTQAEVHLSFNLGAGGQSNGSNLGEQNSSNSSNEYDISAASETLNPGFSPERLPEGSTISLLA